MASNGILDTLSPLEILGLTIIGEARGEPIEGQVAVAWVIRNRLLARPDKYKSYREVCLEPKQFSCWNPSDPNRQTLLSIADKMTRLAITDIYLRQCIFVASGVDSRQIVDNTGGARNYMTKSLFDTGTVEWAKSAKDEVIHGKQIFFNV